MAETKKQLILAKLSDGFWHSGLELFEATGGKTWSWLQRLAELRNVGIEIEKRSISGTHYEYKLITPPEKIDFEKCSLITIDGKQSTDNGKKKEKPEKEIKIKQFGQMELVF